MSEIEISKIRLSSRDRSAFIKFPWRIYRKDPAWVPPLILERKAFLDRKNATLFTNTATPPYSWPGPAVGGNEICGRIMASDNPNYNSLHQSNVGCFGLFECINDRDVAAALFAAAGEWMRRKGRTEMMGPIDYSTNYVCGLLIDGFQHPPTLLTAHNPPYYVDLIEGSPVRPKPRIGTRGGSRNFPSRPHGFRKIAMARAGKQGVTDPTD